MSTSRRTNTENGVHIHIEFYSTIKNKTLPFAGKWMEELEITMLNESPLFEQR